MQPKSFKPKLSLEETSSTTTTTLNTLRNALTTTDSTYSLTKGLKSPQASGPVKVVNLHETAAEKEDHILYIVKQSERTDEEAWILYQYLKDYKFFNLFMKMTNELYQKDWLVHVFKKLKYERFTAGQAIVTEGDPSNGKMYIILTGEVLVMVKKIGAIGGSSLEVTKSLWDSVSAAKKLIRTGSKLQKLATMNVDNGSLGSLYPDGPIKVRPRNKTRVIKQPSLQVIEEKSSRSRLTTKHEKESEDSLDESLQPSVGIPSLTKVTTEEELKRNRNLMLYGYVKDTIVKGGYFGERALEATNLKRSASIVAQTDCDLLALEKAEYDLIKRIFQNRTKLLLNFVMDNLPGLNNIHSTVLFQNYVYLFEEKTLAYKSHLFHEGDHGDKFYLVYNGTCEIYRTIIYEDTPIVYSGRATTGQQTPLAQPRKVREKIVLSAIKEGGVVGEGILYMEDPTYSYSVQATSDNCKVLAIDKASFILKFTQETFDKIRELYHDKKEYKARIFKEKLEQKGFEVKDQDLDVFYPFCKKKNENNNKKVLATSYQEIENKPDLINSERTKFKEGGVLLHNFDLKPIITSPRSWETSITTRRTSRRHQNIPHIDRVFSEQDIKEMFHTIKKQPKNATSAVLRSSKSPSISTKLSLRQGSMESVGGMSPIPTSKAQADFSPKMIRAGTLETLEEEMRETPAIPKLDIKQNIAKNLFSEQESTTLRKETTQASTMRKEYKYRKFYTPRGSITYKNEGSFGNDNKETNNTFELDMSPRIPRPLVICRTERNTSLRKIELTSVTTLARALSDPQAKVMSAVSKKEPKKRLQLRIKSNGGLVDFAGKNYTVSSVKERVEQKKVENMNTREDSEDIMPKKRPLTLRKIKTRKTSQEDILMSKTSSPMLQKVSMEACFFSGLKV